MKGHCGTCRGLYTLRKDGTLRRHKPWRNDRYYCEGSLTKPTHKVAAV